MRIGFLLNHEGAHQVGHAMPIALAMASSDKSVTVEVYVACGAAETEARRMAAGAPSRISIICLKDAGWLGSAISAVTRDSVPGKRVSILYRNRALFAGLAALVVPEKTSLMLKTRFGLRDLPLIHTRHGAGDRAVGFDKASGAFDLVLLSGQKIKDRLAQAGLLRPGGFAVVGYPKFDRLLSQSPPPPLFNNGRPTVLYNPHASPVLSSWYRMGPAILEHFAKQREFNLIFAPHVMLFTKRYHASLSPPGFAKVPPVPASIAKSPHIHVDLGSSASIDMTYTRMADVYLGDASSQVYEFLANPGPCIFVNPQNLPWQDDVNFAHWTAGPVVSNLAMLKPALDRARMRPHAYREVQENLFSYSFDLTSEPSAQRAARAILDWLEHAVR
ncbi:hypothetical protein [Tardiphaga sp.]|uniref:hypothetical protein n=1 Tax=Tardiphaga sp. TaxID=1926292 RepID=UPI003529F45C